MAGSKLSFPVILLITINSIMGTGIFFLPAVGAREAGLFAIISWIIMGFIAVYFSMIFGELVSRYPKEGGVYEYAKEAFGFFPSFLLGWMTLITANITIAMLMVGAIKYVGSNLNNIFIAGLSILFVLIFNFIAFKGLRTGKVMLLTFAGLTLTTVGGILIPGLAAFNPSNFTGWLSHSAFSSLDAGFAGLFSGAAIVLGTVFFIAETFFGWETTTFLAEQVRNPKKIMPKAMVVGTVLIAVISFLFVVASKSILHWSELASSITPLADLASTIYGPWIVPVYSIMVYLAIIGSVAGWIVAAPNLLVALSKDRLFPPSFAQPHPKTGTPYKAIIFQTIVTSGLIVVGAGSYETLLHLLVPMLLIMYASVVLSLILIRRKHPSFDGYIAPGGRFGPSILIMVTLGLIAMWVTNQPDAVHTLQIIAGFVIIGIPVYLLMNFHYNPHATVSFHNKTAELSRLFERLFLPLKIRRRLLAGLSERERVLFLGAGSGVLIKELPHPDEHITVLEHSEVLAKQLSKRFPHVRVIYDNHAISRVHPSIETADVLISVSFLSHIQDIPSYLKHIHSVLPENAKVRFFDYADFYRVIPNSIPSVSKLQEMFREHGFAVKVEKIKGVLWSYLIIEGIKSDSAGFYI
ncbi:MAG: amino acid permease [Candidatus Woesearchaeota archaeon]